MFSHNFSFVGYCILIRASCPIMSSRLPLFTLKRDFEPSILKTVKLEQSFEGGNKVNPLLAEEDGSTSFQKVKKIGPQKKTNRLLFINISCTTKNNRKINHSYVVIIFATRDSALCRLRSTK